MSEKLVESLYRSFAERDHAAMARCYRADAHFSDPVFPALHGWRIAAMWRMLCERGKDLRIGFSGVRSDAESGRVRWEATYTFSATGRQVHNVVDAHFEFRDGKILRHEDRFNLWRWTRMALGPIKGSLLGWTPLVQGAVRRQAAAGLSQFIELRGLEPTP